MGLGDKLKNLAKQAQDSAAEHREQLQGAVEAATVVADRKTKGRHTDKIAKMGQKASGALDRLGDHDDTAPAGQAAAAPGEASTGQEPSATETRSAGEDRLG